METHVAQPPVNMAQKQPSAPPAPVRRKLHVPAEPLVFAALLIALVTFIAKSGTASAAEDAASVAPATVAHHTAR